MAALRTAADLFGRLFDAIDDDHSGYLEEAEGKAYLSCSGCAAEELDYCWDDLVRAADENGDGRISKEEFLTYVLGAEELDGSGCLVDKEYQRDLEQELRQRVEAASWPVKWTAELSGSDCPPLLPTEGLLAVLGLDAAKLEELAAISARGDHL